MNFLYKYSKWLIIVLFLIGYIAYMTMRPTASIEQTVKDWRSWLHLFFVVFLQISMLDIAIDNATQEGIVSEEFTLANTLNNKIITSVNNEMQEFREYTQKLNDHEKQIVLEDFLFSVGKKKVEDLTKKELKSFKKIKPIQHNIYGFNLPLYYEAQKNGKIDYRASIKKNEGIKVKKIKRAISGIMFGAMTVNITLAFENLADALASVLIISFGLVITYVMTYFPRLFKFKFEIPQKVIQKNTFYEGYINYKNGTHVLKKLEYKEKPKEQIQKEQPKEEPQEQIKQEEIQEKALQ